VTTTIGGLMATITEKDFVKITDNIWIAIHGKSLVLVEVKKGNCEIAIRDLYSAQVGIETSVTPYWSKAIKVANEYFNNLRIAEQNQ
jgi:hypothetical protein